MNTALIFFIILAAAAVITALAMLFSRNAVYAALFLILNFSAVAFLYLTLGAPVIAMAQVTVYAGAIMILFLFVIMLLGADNQPMASIRSWQRPAAVILGLVLAVEGVVLVALRGAGKMQSAPAQVPANFAAPADIGKLLFNQYMLPFEVTGVILLVAVIGAIVLTQGEKRVYKRDERRDE